MARLFNEGDWVRLRQPVQVTDWDGSRHTLQRGHEGQVIVGDDAHQGSQIVEFRIDVFDTKGQPKEFPLFVDEVFLDDQLELVERG